MRGIYRMSSTSFVITCPHCSNLMLIVELNCKIFRHAALKSNGEQINPHASKEDCEKLIEDDAIYGCGKPFQIQTNELNEFIAIICDYI